MAKYFTAFAIVFVTASVTKCAQLPKFTDSKAFKQGVENDEENDRGVDQNARRVQGQWILNADRTMEEPDLRKTMEAMSAMAAVNKNLNQLDGLMRQGLPEKGKGKQEAVRISLLPSQMQKPDQHMHIYNPNIFYPGVIDNLENNTSSYSELPKRKRKPVSTEKSLRGNALPNAFQLFGSAQDGGLHFGTDDGSMTSRRPKPSYTDDVDPGDGEGWYNYPITRPSGPNPAWHLSTIRSIYQRQRLFKRSPKRRCKKTKKTRDERKKFNKKKKMRRKMRIIISKKKKTKKRKGDGTYRGGRGRKPRLHKKPHRGNATVTPGVRRGNGSDDESSDSSSEGPVAGAYIGSDSSYIPPSDEEYEEDGDDEYRSDNEEEGEEGDEEDDEGDEEEECETVEEETGGEKGNEGEKNEDKKSKNGKDDGEKVEKSGTEKKTRGKGVSERSRDENRLRSAKTGLNLNGETRSQNNNKNYIKTNEDNIINILKAQQLKYLANNKHTLASILMHPLDEDAPALADDKHVTRFDRAGRLHANTLGQHWQRSEKENIKGEHENSGRHGANRVKVSAGTGDIFSEIISNAKREKEWKTKHKIGPRVADGNSGVLHSGVLHNGVIPAGDNRQTA